MFLLFKNGTTLNSKCIKMIIPSNKLKPYSCYDIIIKLKDSADDIVLNFPTEYKREEYLKYLLSKLKTINMLLHCTEMDHDITINI